MHDATWHNHAKYVLPNIFTLSFYHTSLSFVTNFMRSSKIILTQLIKVDLAGRGLDDPCMRTRFFSFTNSEAHPATYLTDTRVSFPMRMKTYHTTQSKFEGQESVELYLCPPLSSWCVQAQLYLYLENKML
jgi:hypothetical protein